MLETILKGTGAMPEEYEKMERLYEKLKEYGSSDAYPFHMPGHKRRLGMPEEILDIDITEIDGFDNLHHAEGILKEAQQRAARLYGSGETFYLVNGSTAGILAAISACTTYGGTILMARNCHKAAYHAAELRGLRTLYLYPHDAGGAEREFPESAIGMADRKPGRRSPVSGGSICPEDVCRALEQDRDIQAVFITSPTYEGIVSDVQRIAEITHSFGVPLIVDEAHGAHFGFHPYFPENSVKLGADIVIHSLHKTLPSMTQTALLHRNGALVESGRVKKYLGIYQTSSPSYVLMASMDACISLLEKEADTLFVDYARRLEKFALETEQLRHIHLYRAPGKRASAAFSETDGKKSEKNGGSLLEKNRFPVQDSSKLVLWAEGKSGKWLSGQLRERFHLELEMEAGGYAIALTSLADTQEGFDRLAAALRELDGSEVFEERAGNDCGEKTAVPRCRQIMTIAEADACGQERMPLADSAGRISVEYIYLYPPGIPLIVPGEEISQALIQYLSYCQAAGLSLQGLSDYAGETVLCVR